MKPCDSEISSDCGFTGDKNKTDMESTTNIIISTAVNSSELNNITTIIPTSPIGPGYIDAYNIYLYIMIILGVFGNVCVLTVFLHTPPSNTTDWFILAITVCDFISSFVNVPVYATFTNGYWRVYGTTLICRLHMFLSQSIVLSSAFLICGLALDRYLKICRQLSSFTRERARNVCILITVVTTILSIPCFVMYENRGGQCVPRVMDTRLFAYYLLVFITFICAAIVVVFSYYKVTKAVIVSEANVARHSELNKGNINVGCCCFPSNRNNRVAPSVSTVYHSGLFRDTVLNSSQHSTQVHTEKFNDHLQVPRPLHKPSRSITSDSGTQCIEREHPNNRTLSGTSSSHLKQRNSSSLRTTKISFLVCSVFILSWVPPWLSFVIASIPSFKGNVNLIKFMLFGRMTYLINGFSNPIIYALLNKKFRRHIMYIFCCRKMGLFNSRVNHLV